ncbi:MAG: hypothetical protein EP329_09285 [Deltaproteobacteria bacterium]|nr:MAG: hypothetical protein EP329_09285 [Deltaproteobacteria bacterium]
MSTIAARLLDESVRPDVISECCNIIDRQVSAKKGFSGIAIKGAYKTVKAIKRGFVRGVVDALLDEWIEKLAGFEAEHLAAGGSVETLPAFLVGERARVAEALISVTDARAETTKHKTAQKLYHRFRPSALANVEEGVEDLAGLVERFGMVEPGSAPAAASSN